MHVNLVRRGISKTEATRIVHDFADWPFVDNTLELLQVALDEHARWEISLAKGQARSRPLPVNQWTLLP